MLGHGRNGEEWSIDYKAIAGDPQFDSTQAELDNYLARTFKRKDGTLMKISGTAVDTGGHRTKAVYAYCKARANQRVFAIKGANTKTAPLTNKTIENMVANELTLFSIGVHTFKDDFYANLAITERGANFCHFPNKPVYNDKYFKMLTAEKRDDKGNYIKVRVRNEALDCRIYAKAVLSIMGVTMNHIQRPVIYVGEHKTTAQKQTNTNNSITPSDHLNDY